MVNVPVRLGESKMAKKKGEDTLPVAVDFTSYAKEALIFASRLVGKLAAKILVLQGVITLPAGIAAGRAGDD